MSYSSRGNGRHDQGRGRQPFDRGHDWGHQRQGWSHDNDGPSQEFGSYRDRPYDDRRDMARDFNQQQYGGSSHDDIGETSTMPAHKPKKEKPPPYLTGKAIDYSQEEFGERFHDDKDLLPWDFRERGSSNRVRRDDCLDRKYESDYREPNCYGYGSNKQKTYEYDRQGSHPSHRDNSDDHRFGNENEPRLLSNIPQRHGDDNYKNQNYSHIYGNQNQDQCSERGPFHTYSHGLNERPCPPQSHNQGRDERPASQRYQERNARPGSPLNCNKERNESSDSRNYYQDRNEKSDWPQGYYQGRSDRPGFQRSNQEGSKRYAPSQRYDLERPESLHSYNVGRNERSGSSQSYNVGRNDRSGPSQNYNVGRNERLGPPRRYNEGRNERPGLPRSYNEGRNERPGSPQNFNEGRSERPGPSQSYSLGRNERSGSSQNYNLGRNERPSPSQSYNEGRNERPWLLKSYNEGRNERPGSSQSYHEERSERSWVSQNYNEGRNERHVPSQRFVQGRPDSPKCYNQVQNEKPDDPTGSFYPRRNERAGISQSYNLGRNERPGTPESYNLGRNERPGSPQSYYRGRNEGPNSQNYLQRQDEKPGPPQSFHQEHCDVTDNPPNKFSQKTQHFEEDSPQSLNSEELFLRSLSPPINELKSPQDLPGQPPKKIRVFIKKLPMDYPREKIRSSLNKSGFKVSHVNRMQPLKIFHIQLKYTPNVMDVFNVKKINGVDVDIVDPRSLRTKAKTKQMKKYLKKPRFKNQAFPVPQTGMWYRERNREKQKAAGVRLTKKERAQQRMQKKTQISIELPVEKVVAIRRFLDGIGIEAPPTISQIRGSVEGPSANLHDKYKHLEDSEFKRRFLTSISGSIEESMWNSLTELNRSQLVYNMDSELDKKYYEELERKQYNSHYVKMLNFREHLPAYNKRDELIALLDKHQCIVVSGETGCGKTTQVPQFILDHEIRSGKGSQCHILCTQPRRISAISVAERVALERGENVGTSVGYHIRLERSLPRKSGSIIFCTTGILLQVLQTNPVLKYVSHVILDEIHERDILSDFSIAILRELIQMRKDLKVILMSATLNAERFSTYFNNCPSIHIPGFTFPVKEFYIEDVMKLTGVHYDNKGNQKSGPAGAKYLKNDKKYQKYLTFLEPYIRNMREQKNYSNKILDYLLSPDAEQINLTLILALLKHICNCEPPGAILVFLPGWDKISALVNKMAACGSFPESRYIIIGLHSMMPTVTQRTIFDRPPHGKRKIVIATNIAETSITIDDIVYVINCGKIKVKNFDPENNVSTLREEWVSLANSKQRKGRAGRVQEGVCYHMYSRTKELVLEDFQVPEMLRTRLEQVILQIKVLQLGKAEPFLKRVMDPPANITVSLSVKLLMDMNALDNEEHLTPLGYHLANLPVDPQPGKMILLASLFGCLDPITSIAASLSFKDAFVTPLGKEDLVSLAKIELAKGTKSDHILMAEVIKGWRQAKAEGRGSQFSSHYFLSYNTLTLLSDMKKQFVDHLYEMKFIADKNVQSPMSNPNSENHALLRSIICAGLYPNVAAVWRKTKKRMLLLTAEDGNVSVHPKSVNFKVPNFESGFLAYFLKIKSKSVLLHDTSMIFPMSLIFFCQSFTIEDAPPKKLIQLNNNMCFVCEPHVASLIQELRAWLDWLLEYKIAHPGVTDWFTPNDEVMILKAIVVLLTAESQLYLQEYSDYSDDDQNDYEDNPYYEYKNNDF